MPQQPSDSHSGGTERHCGCDASVSPQSARRAPRVACGTVHKSRPLSTCAPVPSWERVARAAGHEQSCATTGASNSACWRPGRLLQLGQRVGLVLVRALRSTCVAPPHGATYTVARCASTPPFSLPTPHTACAPTFRTDAVCKPPPCSDLPTYLNGSGTCQGTLLCSSATNACSTPTCVPGTTAGVPGCTNQVRQQHTLCAQRLTHRLCGHRLRQRRSPKPLAGRRRVHSRPMHAARPPSCRPPSLPSLRWWPRIARTSSLWWSITTARPHSLKRWAATTWT